MYIKYDKPVIWGRGYIAVEFFFLVSGYLFAKSLLKHTSNDSGTIIQDSIAFMFGKYKSFFPYHIFAVICTFIYCIVQFKWESSLWLQNLIRILPEILLLQLGGLKNISELNYEWYLSAMLIVMFILTPIVIKYRKLFLYWIAPIIALFSYGYLANTTNTLNTFEVWGGLVYSGIIRALGGICLGCVCYAVSETKVIERFNRYFLIFTEIMIYLIALMYTHFKIDVAFEFGLVLLLAVAVTISFSDKTSITIFNNRFIYFLGKLSFPIYLNQMWLKYVISNLEWDKGLGLHLLLYISILIAVSVLNIALYEGAVLIFTDGNKTKKQQKHKKRKRV